MKKDLRVKNIIVIGGGSGIGYETAQKLLDNNAKNVILVSRNIEKLKRAKEKLNCNETQNIHVVEFDIANIKSHESMIKDVEQRIGVIPDGMVISSGINFNGANWRGFNISENEWDTVMNTNLKGVFFLMRTFSNYLHGNLVKGNICIVSSISAHRDLLSVYQISKNAISGIVHAYGKHLCERGIVLNCVEPGTTNTDMMSGLSQYTDGKRDGKMESEMEKNGMIIPSED